VSLFNVEAALAAQMSPAVRPTGIFPGVPAGQSTTGHCKVWKPQVAQEPLRQSEDSKFVVHGNEENGGEQYWES